VAITRFAPCTRSIAPPIPFAIFPGIIQLARCEEEMSFPRFGGQAACVDHAA
jgi:hypothetical protein